MRPKGKPQSSDETHITWQQFWRLHPPLGNPHCLQHPSAERATDDGCQCGRQLGCQRLQRRWVKIGQVQVAPPRPWRARRGCGQVWRAAVARHLLLAHIITLYNSATIRDSAPVSATLLSGFEQYTSSQCDEAITPSASSLRVAISLCR